MSEQPQIDRLISATASTLQTIAPALPTLATVEKVMSSAREATNRGYFLPDEDEAVRLVFSSYLTTRAALLAASGGAPPLRLGRAISTSTQTTRNFRGCLLRGLPVDAVWPVPD